VVIGKHTQTLLHLTVHSTGCQDSIYYFRSSAKHKERISKIILQAPVSDREYMQQDTEKTNYYLNLAKQLIGDSKKDQLLPREADMVPISAYR
jgi:hypothetical protein